MTLKLSGLEQNLALGVFLIFHFPNLQVTLKLSGLEHQLEQVSRDKQELLVQKGKLEQAAEVRLLKKNSKTPVT